MCRQQQMSPRWTYGARAAWIEHAAGGFSGAQGKPGPVSDHSTPCDHDFYDFTIFRKFYDFSGGNVPPVISELKRYTQKELDIRDGIIKFDNRRSPRLLEVHMKNQDIEELRRGGRKARSIARALGQIK